MRLGVVLEQLLSPVPGGTGRFARELTSALVAAHPDHEVVAWTAWHRDTFGARIAGTSSRALPLGRRALASLWERGWGPAVRADAVLAPTLLVPVVRAGTRLAVVVHDTVPWTHPETLTPRGVRFHLRMARRAAREAAAVLVPTQAVAQELALHLPELDPARIAVCGAGPSAAVTTPPADAATRRARLGLPERYALVIGTREPRKGIDTAVRASQEPSWPVDLGLVLAGRQGWGGVPPLPPTRLVDAPGDDDLAAVLAGATLLLAPSRAEGFGLPVVEAMAAGVPVVVSDVPALREVAADAASVVPVGDHVALARAVAELARDPALRAQRAALGRRRASAYSWEAVAHRVWTALNP